MHLFIVLSVMEYVIFLWNPENIKMGNVEVEI